MDFLSVWKQYGEMTDTALLGYLAMPDIPKTLRKSMTYSITAGGKRLRPALLLATSEMLGGDPMEAMPFACGIEMIHTYSLIHDDLPAMDDDDFRRGKPTNHKVFGDAIAILSGDGLLNYAYQIILEAALRPGRDLRAHIAALRCIADGAGIAGMIAGQVADIENEGNTSAGAEELRYIHNHKTADMILSATLSGAYLCGAGPETLEALRAYGVNLGLAFQITDDLLDVYGDAGKLGKTLGKDAAAEKLTFVRVYGMELAQEMARECTENALKALAGFGPEADFLRELARFMLNRDH